jgi:enoyl-CoA hydratase/carnithine racemase
MRSLVDCGFLKLQDKPAAWLMRFVPPIGAGQAIGYAKLAITKGYKEALTSSLLLERHLQEQLFRASDSKEGMKAYIEKRKPYFIGD